MQTGQLLLTGAWVVVKGVYQYFIHDDDEEVTLPAFIVFLLAGFIMIVLATETMRAVFNYIVQAATQNDSISSSVFLVLVFGIDLATGYFLRKPDRKQKTSALNGIVNRVLFRGIVFYILCMAAIGILSLVFLFMIYAGIMFHW